MKTINFKSFTTQEIINISPDVRIINSKDFKPSETLTISDHIELTTNKGSENLYCDVTVYKIDAYTPIILRLYTKEAHNTLKEIINEIIKQS